MLPGGRLLASSDETGNVAVADLRMLGNARQPLLWQVHIPHVSTISVSTCLQASEKWKVYEVS